jgi:hypothetical protein
MLPQQEANAKTSVSVGVKFGVAKLFSINWIGLFSQAGHNDSNFIQH